MIYKFWTHFCFILCAYNLILLVDEGRLTSFNKERIEYNNRRYSICLPIKDLIDKDLFKLDRFYKPRDLIENVTDLILNDNKPYLILESSYIRFNYVCIVFKQEKFYLIFPNISSFKFKLFIDPSDDTQIHFFESVYTHNRLDDAAFILELLITNIKFLQSPYDTNCTQTRTYLGQHHPNYVKTRCLLDCYRLNMINSSILYYEYHENVFLSLNQTELKSIKKCNDECEPTDCYAKLFYKHLKFNREDNNLPRIDVKINTMISNPILDKLDLYAQFISLIFLFINVSFHDVFAIVISLLKKRIDKHLLMKLNQMALLTFIVLLGYQTVYLVQDYFQYNFIIRDNIRPVKDFLPYNIFVCLPVQLAYLSEENAELAFENESVFKEKTFTEIENDTDHSFKDLIIRSYLRKGPIKIPYEIQPANETIFKGEEFLVENRKTKLLSRCLKVVMNIREYKYEKSLGFTQLVLELKYLDFKAYYNDPNARLTFNQVYIKRKTRLFIIEKNYLKAPFRSQCVDYGQTDSKCNKKDSCIDSCFNEWFLKNHSSLSIESVIYKDHLDRSLLSSTRFSYDEDKRIRQDCEKMHVNMDCQELEFVEEFEHYEFYSNKTLRNQIVIDLYLYKEVTSEMEKTTLVLLFFSILNYESIFIGMTMKKVLEALIYLIKKRFLNAEHMKITTLIVISLCLLGFIGHSFFIFINIFISPLIGSEYFERLIQLDSADFMICVESNLGQLVDEYEKPTGVYFETITPHLAFEHVFKKITILDEHLRERNVSAEDIVAKKLKGKLTIKVVFVRNMKCFSFKTNFTYLENELIKFDQLFFFKIYFKENFYKADCNCSKIYIAFFDKIKGTFEKLESYFLRKNETIKTTFEIQPVIIEFEYKDKFFYIKNPMAYFKTDSYLNDDYLYYKEMIRNFVEITNCSTQLRPLHSKVKMHLQVDDQLFEQYFLQIQKKIDSSPFIHPDYTAEVFNLNSMLMLQSIEHPEITVVPTIFKYKQKMTNDSNYAKFIINILNSLSLWLSLSVMELHIYALKLFILLQKFFNLLLRFETFLRPNRFIL